MEALASGLPVASFAVAAAAEHVADGLAGRLVAPGDKAAFVAAVESLAAPGSALESMRDAALAAARRATWPEVLARFEARLEDTVHGFETPQSRVPVVA
jgi:glycosyltransferase involved in cell wall biosynthesis